MSVAGHSLIFYGDNTSRKKKYPEVLRPVILTKLSHSDLRLICLAN